MIYHKHVHCTMFVMGGGGPGFGSVGGLSLEVCGGGWVWKCVWGGSVFGSI